ncbi:MAG: hypothetical protein Q9220_003952 [cf. Caloplaca sp. 1 TL-2023]
MNNTLTAVPSNVVEPSVSNNEVPDPDEDDLDELDGHLLRDDGKKIGQLMVRTDLLDDFSSNKPKDISNSTQNASSPDHHLSAPAAHDFNEQLQAQMAAMMGNDDESSEMQTEIESILRELSSAVNPPPTVADMGKDADPSDTPAATEESFQEAVLRTMQRMQTSGDKADAAASAGDESMDDLTSMLRELQSGDPHGTTGDDELGKVLMTIMDQLTNKDILYEPMKELNDNFPVWITKNGASVHEADLLRYEKQQRLIAEIVERFEQSAYSDNNAKDREFIVERMQEVIQDGGPVQTQTNRATQMQAAGSPPADLVGNMSGTQAALQDMGSSCPQQ